MRSMFFNGTVTSNVSEFIYNAANNYLIGQLQVSNPPPILTDDIAKRSCNQYFCGKGHWTRLYDQLSRNH